MKFMLLWNVSVVYFVIFIVFPFDVFGSVDFQDIWARNLKNFKFDRAKQSFCLKLSDGRIVGESVDKKMKPASISKLYTTLWALKRLGGMHQFKTDFYVKDRVLFVRGGQDPFFVSENIFYILSELNKLGIYHLDELVFDDDLYLNWQDKPEFIAEMLYAFFNTAGWVNQIHNDYQQMLSKIQHLNLNLKIQKPQMTLGNVRHLSRLLKLEENNHRLTFHSSPIHFHLKEVNCYSNNFYADKIFQYLGGSAKLANFLKDIFSIDSTTAYFYTGSGLGKNYTTCRLTLRMLHELEKTLSALNFSLQDVMAVAGHDPGTLQGRLINSSYPKAIVAKTGTLDRVSTLAGKLFEEEGGRMFVIFNSMIDVAKGREFQDQFIMDIFLSSESLNYNYRGYSPLMETNLKITSYQAQN